MKRTIILVSILFGTAALGLDSQGQDAPLKPERETSAPGASRKVSSAEEGTVATTREVLADGVLKEETDLDFDQAAEKYQRIIREYRERRSAAAEATYRLANIYLKKGEKDRARELFEQAYRDFSDLHPLAERTADRLKMLGASVPSRGMAGTSSIVGASRYEGHASAPSAGGGGFAGGFGGGGFGGSGGYGATPGVGVAGTARGQSVGVTNNFQGADGMQFRERLQAIVSRAQESDAEVEVRQELARAQQNYAAAEEERDKASRVYRSVKQAAPEVLPKPASEDPRYRELKGQFEEAVLGDDAAKAKALQERIVRWVQKIYIPELQAQVESEEVDYRNAALRVDDLKSRLKAAREKNAKP